MIRKARVPDAQGIQALVNHFAERDEMLPRALNAIYENIRDFYIYEEDGKILGCCALHVTWGDLAEVKSLAVAEDAHGKGLGSNLVQTCINEAKEIGIPKVFALTYVPGFFEKQGFHRIDKSTLPHKIWSECINCHKFPDCGEEAVAMEISR